MCARRLIEGWVWALLLRKVCVGEILTDGWSGLISWEKACRAEGWLVGFLGFVVWEICVWERIS